MVNLVLQAQFTIIIPMRWTKKPTKDWMRFPAKKHAMKKEKNAKYGMTRVMRNNPASAENPDRICIFIFLLLWRYPVCWLYILTLPKKKKVAVLNRNR